MVKEIGLDLLQLLQNKTKNYSIETCPRTVPGREQIGELSLCQVGVNLGNYLAGLDKNRDKVLTKEEAPDLLCFKEGINAISIYDEMKRSLLIKDGKSTPEQTEILRCAVAQYENVISEDKNK